MSKANSTDLLRENLAGLRLALASLERTWQATRTLGNGPDYKNEELDLIEVRGARFARTADFLVNKALRSLDRYELEPEGTLIDVVNRAEKRGLIAQARDLRRMKELRNEIVPEYLPHQQVELLADLKVQVPLLLETGQRLVTYADEVLTR
jgi:hypothetical protein